jgi:hypothetical protein
LKIGNQPICLWSRDASDSRNHLLQLFWTKTIEKEVCDDQVVSFTGRQPIQYVSMDKSDTATFQIVTHQLPTRPGNHELTRIHTGDLCISKPTATLDQPTTMTFTQQQNAFLVAVFDQGRQRGSVAIFRQQG